MEEVLIIGKVWPEPVSSAAGARMLQIIRMCLNRNWKVTFASAARYTEFSELPDHVNMQRVEIRLNDVSFDEFILKLNPSLVIFDRFTSEEQFGWRVATHCPGALRVLDTEDLHGLREARYIALKENRPMGDEDLLNDVCLREIASVYRCDLSLIISSYEMELLQNFFKVSPDLLYYLPLRTDRIETEQIQELPGFDNRQHFSMLGNFLHAPNADAVFHLKSGIWPLIRQRLPAAEVHVYGAYPNGKIRSLHAPGEGFLVKGRAISSVSVMRGSRVSLAPLRFGAGQKGKLLEAMCCGTPSVTTTVGAEGMYGHLPWAGIVADKDLDFAEAAVRLYTDADVWWQSRDAGFRIVNELFATDRTAPLLSKIQELKEDLKNQRVKNFTGAMLMHSYMQNTKFMALWIEAKNKNIHNPT